MSAITSLGVGSGLDLESLVSKLMSIEQAPLTAIQKKTSSANTKISSLGTLKSKLADLQTAGNALKTDIGISSLEKFTTYSATSSTGTVASATVGAGAVAGNYDLFVSNLARATRFTSSVFTATNSAIGTIGDTLTFDFATPDAEGNSRTKSITLDNTNNSLAGLRNSINGAKMGVTATIVNGSALAHKLVITGQEGLDNEITLSIAPGFTSTSTYAALTDPVGTVGENLSFDFGTPAIVGGTRSKTITLDSSNNTLAGLRDAINAEGMGVTASISGTVGAYKLVLSGQGGLNNAITLGGDLATALPASNVTELQKVATEKSSAEDAVFTVNGIDASSSTNNASKTLDGVTLKLNTLGATTLTIASDYSEKMTANLNSFITAYNAANSTMKTMGAYNPTTKVAGALQGNSILRVAQTQTRNLLFNTTAGGSSSFQRLSDLGVTVGTDGALSLNSSKLSSALAADPSAVASLLGKVGTEFNKTIEKFVSSSGTIKISTDSINSMVKELSNRSEAIERRLVTIEARIRKQFSSLDTLISGLNSTSDYLTQQIANLSG